MKPLLFSLWLYRWNSCSFIGEYSLWPWWLFQGNIPPAGGQFCLEGS